MEANATLEELLEENKKLRKALQKAKEKKSAKGVETMFRTTMGSHLQLSSIADSKANLMISINAIIASIMISSFVRNFASVPHLLFPSILLTGVCMLTTSFAVLATRPHIAPSREAAGKRDLLFFGDYITLSRDAYQQSMKEMMQDPDKLYTTMIDNIYLQGKVLARKYRLLKLSYTVFVIGLGLVFVSYVLAWAFFRR
ncbi:Pycsar system effector family protein [Pontibacter liquoris]|uniref:Pycsar system effector family protein n=1 Tax=Pontibacter liquoris TaxID=2905677 RepID=UPI001FA7A30D|nr:Pycsar system effector family protein [Pontibacter liquoris]